MPIIWVVEKVKTSGPIVTLSLIGNFAVRAFASLDSLAKVSRISGEGMPNLLVLDAHVIAKFGFAKVREILPPCTADTPVVIVDSVRHNDCIALGNTFFYQISEDSWGLSNFIQGLLLEDKKPISQLMIKYKGIALDPERHRLTIAQNSEILDLPQKESQLLSLFLTKRGRCLSRQQIQEIIWPGIKVTPRTIDSHISRLRSKLAQSEVEIKSVYRGGYFLR